jgi:hypothetical protein
VAAEGCLDGVGFVQVAQRRGRAVRVEVLDLIGIDTGVFQAITIERRGPSTSGAVMWYASALMPKPVSSA